MPLSKEERSDVLLSNIDKDDCGVIAIQAVTKLGRTRCMELALLAGYKPGEGTPPDGIEPMLADELDYKVEQVEVERGETAATFSMRNEYGIYLVHVQGQDRKGRAYGHVMALVEGDLYNSRGFFGDPVAEVWKVDAR